MKRIEIDAKTHFLGFLILIIATVTGIAQRKVDDIAPLDLRTSKTAFLSFAGIHQNSIEQRGNSYSDGGNWLYSECFQNLANSGRFTLLRQPINADIILEIKLEDITQPSPTAGGNTMYTSADPQVWLRIIDRKTGVLLWTLIKHVELSRKEADRDRNLKKAVSDLLADLSTLTQPSSNP